jgi:HSP20 family protein
MSLIPWKNKSADGGSMERVTDPLRRFRNEMDRVFDRFLESPWGLPSDPFGEGGWLPSLDMSETDKHVIIRAEMPGVDPKDINLTISGNVLTLSGEKKEVSQRKSESWHHTERSFGSFRRSMQLPTYVDAEKVSAEHAHGVLTIQLEKLQSATPKRIEVKSK